MANIKLVALDLDGTLFTSDRRITPRTIEALKKAIEQGVTVIISTGRPYCGIPFAQLQDVAMKYAITTNGAAVYDIEGVRDYGPEHVGSDKKILFEECISDSQIREILPFLLSKDIHMDAFIHGDGYTPASRVAVAEELPIEPALKRYIMTTRTRVEDFEDYIFSNQLPVQKMTLNFKQAEDGVSFIDRDDVRNYLESRGDVTVVSGGYANLEFTNQDVTKGNALRKLAKKLGIPMECTMAIGDTENDLSILEAAEIGVAMGNAPADIQAKADWVSSSNEEDGVALAIEKFVLNI